MLGPLVAMACKEGMSPVNSLDIMKSMYAATTTILYADKARFHKKLLMQAFCNYPVILSGNSLTAVVQTIKGLQK